MDSKSEGAENLGALLGYDGFLKETAWIKDATKAIGGCNGDGAGYDIDLCRSVICDLTTRLIAIGEWVEREKGSLREQAHEMDYGVFSYMSNIVSEVKGVLEA